MYDLLLYNTQETKLLVLVLHNQIHLDQVSFLLERPAKICKSDPNITKVAKGVTQLNLKLQKSDPIKIKSCKK